MEYDILVYRALAYLKLRSYLKLGMMVKLTPVLISMIFKLKY